MSNIFTLEQWLQIATKDLTPEAVVSIRKEITDHVKTTLEYQTNAGLSQVEAEKLAVRLLGDPMVFLQRARKTYLTKSEDKRLKQLYSPLKIGKLYYFLFFLYNIFVFLNLWHNSFPRFNPYTFNLLCYANLSIPYLLSDKISIKFRGKFWLLYQFVSLILTIIILLANIIRTNIESIRIDEKPDYFLVIFTLFIIIGILSFMFYFYYPIFRKLFMKAKI